MRAPFLFALGVAGVLLAGCQTVTPEQRRAADERQCLSYGFKRGTNAFATCLQRIDLNRDADRRAFLYSDVGWYGPGPYGGRYGPGW
jgi:hypothetical protein